MKWMREQGSWKAASVVALVLWFVARPAHAERSEFGPYRRPASSLDDWGDGRGSHGSSPATGEYVHDGFYLRFAGGLGGGWDKLDGTGRSSEGSMGHLRGNVSGFAGATQVAVGFTPARGWVVGVAVDTVTLVAGSGSLKEGLGRFEFETDQLALYGLLIDYYPDALRGLHLQATGGIASYVMSQGNAENGAVVAPPHAAVGAGISFGVGNQWWVMPDWTVGVLPRLMLGWSSGVDQYGARFRHRALGYSLLLTVTYH